METEQRRNDPNAFCSNCRKSIKNGEEQSVICDEKINKCTQWLNECSLSDDESLSSDSICHSSQTDNLEDDNKLEEWSEENNVCVANKIVMRNNDNDIIWDDITSTKPNRYKNINVYKSKNVHIGNVTNINGPVYIDRFTPTINQNIVFNSSNNNTGTKAPPIVSRRTWLAQPPLDPDDVIYLSKPAKYVIINHTATEPSFTQTDNNLNVRLIQQFHVESRKWNDIGYNFLVGADGSIYEGRGWKTVGAHTYLWNFHSCGIAFIGWFIKELPPPVALQKAKALIRYGVEIGAIAEDYVLLGACQCTSTESPGKKLFEEIKTWEHWDDSISLNNPPDLSTHD